MGSSSFLQECLLHHIKNATWFALVSIPEAGGARVGDVIRGSYREGRGVSWETLMKYLGMKWGLFEKKAVILRKNSGFADLPE